MTVRVGILGAARIAPAALLTPAAGRTDVTVTAIGASTIERAQAFAQTHSIPVAATRQDLIARADVDLVYVALPTSEHAAWCIKALEAGKHVLCEKPFTLRDDEAEAVVALAAARGLRCLEATHYRYHPLCHRLIALVAELGPIERIHAEFAVPVRETPVEFRRIAALGGGAMRDIGFYPVHLVRTLMGSEPAIIEAQAVRTPSGVDESLRAVLSFTNGAEAVVYGGMGAHEKPRASADIICARGRIRVRNFVAPQIGAALTIETASGERTEDVPKSTTFSHQLEAVLSSMQTDARMPTEGRDSIDQVRALNAIYRAAGFAE
jgi:predicted dehydrogenase